MCPLVVMLLLGSASRGSAQILFHTIKSVEYTKCNETILIPCLASNMAAMSLRELFVKWVFEGKTIFFYNGYENKSEPIDKFSSAYIIPDALLRGIASLKMDKKDAVPGNYTCEVTELSREGETTVELKYRVGTAQLLFHTIKTVEYSKYNKTIVIPCLVSNLEALCIKEIFVKWKFEGKTIFFYNGDDNKSEPIHKFSSAYIIPDSLLRGIASLKMDKKDAVPGNYTCEVTELSREGETTVELKYHDESLKLLFYTIRSVKFTNCNETVVIPCLVSNLEALNTKEIFVRWKFEGKTIFFYNGDENKSKRTDKFLSAYIIPDALLRGIASLKMDKKDAVPGNYTCEVTELSREGDTSIELKYHVESWFPTNGIMSILIFPMLTVLLFWGSGIMTLKYNASITKVKIILSIVGGLLLTTIIIVGAILFIPGEYSTKRVSGLSLIVVATVILMILQCSLFITVPGTRMSVFRIIILLLQLLGCGFSVLGLSLSVKECTTIHDALLISGLAIIVLAALLGLVYMKCVE